MNVYLILYNVHIFGAVEEGEYEIIYASLNKQNAKSKYNDAVENIKKNKPWYAGKDYEESTDNTDSVFRCYWGTYCYTFKFIEQKLEGGEE